MFAETGAISWAPKTAVPISNTGWTRVQNASRSRHVFELAWEVDFIGGSAGDVFMVDGIQLERAAAVSAFEPSPSERAAADQRAGIYKLKLERAPKGGAYDTRSFVEKPCYDDSCSRSDWLGLNSAYEAEGRLQLRAKAEDMTGAGAYSPAWEIVLDTSAPTVSTSASMSRSTSGVQTYDLDDRRRRRLDGQPVTGALGRDRHRGPGPRRGQPRGRVRHPAPGHDADVPAGQLRAEPYLLDGPPGRQVHRARDRDRDQVGNKRIRDRIATFDDHPPDIALSGTLKDSENGTLVAGAYDLRVNATDDDRTATVRDSFNDGTLGDTWRHNYGTNWEAEGRARSQCTSGYSGLLSGNRVDLADSALTVEVTKPRRSATAPWRRTSTSSGTGSRSPS